MQPQPKMKTMMVETTHAFVKLKQIKAAVSAGGIKFSLASSLRRASLAQQHLPLDIPEADVQATNIPNDTASRRRHQNRQQHDFCLPFAAASTAPPDSTCSASITFASLKADRSTCKAAPKQAANQAASQSIIRRRRGARFWSRNDGNNHR